MYQMSRIFLYILYDIHKVWNALSVYCHIQPMLNILIIMVCINGFAVCNLRFFVKEIFIDLVYK